MPTVARGDDFKDLGENIFTADDADESRSERTTDIFIVPNLSICVIRGQTTIGSGALGRDAGTARTQSSFTADEADESRSEQDERGDTP